jgi:hypothetical protein
MCETMRHEDLGSFFAIEFHSHMPSVCWGTSADIHHHIQDPATDHLNNFCLCKGRTLVMQSSDHTIYGGGKIILHPILRDAILFITAGAETFQECATIIPKDGGANEDDTRDLSLGDDHIKKRGYRVTY